MDEGGQREFYPEVSDVDRGRCTEWVQQNVLPLLDNAALPLEEVGEAIVAWLSEIDEPVQLISDLEIDSRLVFEAIGDRRDRLTHSVLPVIARPVTMNALKTEYRFWQQEGNRGRQHNALWDARCLRLALIAQAADGAIR